MSELDAILKRLAALEATVAERDRQLAAANKRIVELERLVETLQSTIRRQDVIIRELRQRLGEDDDGNDSTKGGAVGGKARRKLHKKKPGRKPGKGNFSHRMAPEPNQPPVEVAPPEACEFCGGTELRHERIDEPTITDLPPMPAPTITPYRVPVCRCESCARVVRGQHPDIAPGQFGATAHRFGPRLLAMAHWMHVDHGVPAERVCQMMNELAGVDLKPATIFDNARRLAGIGGKGPIGAAYEALRAAMRHHDYIHTDDTGWDIHGDRAWAMAFTSMERPGPDATDADGKPLRAAVPLVTTFQVREQHTNEEVREVVPGDFAGVLKTDRGASYDSAELAGVKQDKCLAHALRNISDAIERQHPGARSFLIQLAGLLRAALALWHAFRDGKLAESTFRKRAAPIKRDLRHLLRAREMKCPHNQRLLDGLGWHLARDQLVRFLDDPFIEPTNNRAERDLRPMVISRRQSHGSKSLRGAYAYCALRSVFATMHNLRLPPLDSFVELLRGRNPFAPHLPA